MPSLPRFLVSGTVAEGLVVPLPPEEARHARVRRLLDGDAAEVLDGAGVTGTGRMTGKGTAVAVESVSRLRGEPGRRWTVALAAAEPSRVEWAVEKGTECGAAAFVLFAAERSQAAHVRVLGARRERLRRVAAEAVKQCGRSVVPPVSGPVPLRDLLGCAGAILVAAPGAPLLGPDEVAGSDGGAVVVGPEGGLSDGELDLLVGAGARLVGLGPRTLRLETAVIAALVRLSGPFG